MNRAGFTLLELLIATLIASILSALLFAALFQVNRYVPVIDNLTGIYEKAAIVNAQLERDISGVTAPNEFYARQKKAEPKKGEEAKKEGAAKKEAEEKQKAAEAKAEADKEKPKKPLEKIFYGVNKEGNIDQLSFITTNSLQVYWSDKAGSAKPRIVRVLYMLKEEPTKDAKKSYSLIRRESNNLEFDPIAKGGKDISEYVLAEGIKSATIEYTFFPPEEPEKEKKAGAEAKVAPEATKKKESKKAPDWAGKQPEKAEAEQKMPVAPQLVEWNIAFWDAQRKRSVPFSFKTRIHSEIEEKRKSDDIGERMMSTLKEFFGQPAAQNKPQTNLAQNNQSMMPKGPMHR